MLSAYEVCCILIETLTHISHWSLLYRVLCVCKYICVIYAYHEIPVANSCWPWAFTTISIMSLPIYSHSGLYSSTNWIMHDSNDSKELCHLLYGQPDWFFSADELHCCTVLYVIFMTTAFAAVFTTTAWPPATGAYAIHDIIPVSLMVVFASVLYSDLSKFALLSSCSYFV